MNTETKNITINAVNGLSRFLLVHLNSEMTIHLQMEFALLYREYKFAMTKVVSEGYSSEQVMDLLISQQAVVVPDASCADDFNDLFETCICDYYSKVHKMNVVSN